MISTHYVTEHFREMKADFNQITTKLNRIEKLQASEMKVIENI